MPQRTHGAEYVCTGCKQIVNMLSDREMVVGSEMRALMDSVRTKPGTAGGEMFIESFLHSYTKI